MVIEHLGLVISYTIWCYILICIFIKLTFVNRKGKKRIIIKLLNNKSFAKKITSRRVRKYVRDEELFDFLCYEYCKRRSRYTKPEKAWFEKFLKKVLSEKIKLSEKKDDLYKVFLMKKIERLRIKSDEINRFTSCMNL